MAVASVTTDINMGPYRIPSNAQNMVMNSVSGKDILSFVNHLTLPLPVSFEPGNSSELTKQFCCIAG